VTDPLFNWLIVYYAEVIWGVICLIGWLIVYYAAVSWGIICLIGWLIVYYAVAKLPPKGGVLRGAYFWNPLTLSALLNRKFDMILI